MRGSPILRAIVAFLALLALAFPLSRLLQSEALPSVSKRVEATPSNASKASLLLQISFTQAPVRFQVLALGEPVWKAEQPQDVMEKTLSLAYPKEGIDLEFEFEWPEGKKAAACVRLTDPAGEEHTSVIWGEGAASEVLTFQ